MTCCKCNSKLRKSSKYTGITQGRTQTAVPFVYAPAVYCKMVVYQNVTPYFVLFVGYYRMEVYMSQYSYMK